MQKYQTCISCGEDKKINTGNPNVDEFHYNSPRKRYEYECKTCRNQRNRDIRARHKENGTTKLYNNKEHSERKEKFIKVFGVTVF